MATLRAGTTATACSSCRTAARRRPCRDIYTREGAEIWLHGRKRSLAGRRPIDMLADGSYDEVLDGVERLQAGAV